MVKQPSFPMTVVINGKRWVIHVYPSLCGLTVHASRHIVLIGKQLHTKEFLDTIIHELIHAIRPDFSEQDVEQLSRRISHTLWRFGYRLPAPIIEALQRQLRDGGA